MVEHCGFKWQLEKELLATTAVLCICTSQRVFYEERVVWKALGLKSLVDNVLAPCLPKGLVIRVLIAKCLWNVCILLVVMMILTSSSFHLKKGRFWYSF